MQTFPNSIYPKCMEKWDNSGTVLIWAAFGPRKHVDYDMIFWTKTF